MSKPVSGESRARRAQLLNTPTAPAAWQMSDGVPALPAWGGGLLALLLLAGAAAMLRKRSRGAGAH